MLFCDFVYEYRGKKWDEAIERPDIDYSQIFEEEAGKIPGKGLSLRLVIMNTC